MVGKLGQALIAEMAATREFQYVPSQGQPQMVESLDGALIGGRERLTWEIDYNDNQRRHQLKLNVEGSLCAILTLDGEGIWRGRDRHTRGVVLLRPLPRGRNLWPTLIDTATFARANPVKDETSGLNFEYEEFLSPQIDWTPFEYSLRDWTMPMQPSSKTAIALVGCDRPLYFKQVVQSLASNPGAHMMPLFVFLDKPLVLTDTTREQIQVAKQYFPQCVIVDRPRNFGCGRNLIDARRQVFDMGYEQAFIFEDDMVLSPYYLSLCLRLMAWADQHYSNVGAVQGWSICTRTPENKRQHQLVVHATWGNWWGYLLKKSAWDKIKDAFYTYEKLFLGGEYRFRPHRSILKWLRQQVSGPLPLIPNSYPITNEWSENAAKFLGGPPTGQDSVTAHLFYKAGLLRLATEVNRGQYIGKEGIHMSPSRWVSFGYDHITLDEMPNDDKIWEFLPAAEGEVLHDLAVDVGGAKLC